nr:exonuclease domain-containing protein [Actinomycetota bacterium]
SNSTLALDAIDYVVVDVETTGFAYNNHDRVVEIAVVRCHPDLGVVDRFVTLVNPDRDLGPTHIHGISSQDVLDAPRFREVIGEVSRHLAGAVVVAHNVNFDLGFLRAEYRRAGFELPEVPTLCTMTLPTTVGLHLPARSLRACCQQLDIPYDDHGAHGGLHDAQASAALLLRLLDHARHRGMATLAALGCASAPVRATRWPTASDHPQLHTRSDASYRRQARFATLAGIVRRVADASPVGDPRVAPYQDLLDRVLEDHVVTSDEVQMLVATAREWGLGPGEIERAHYEYLQALVDAALEDDEISEAERHELDVVAHWLGVENPGLERLVRRAAPASHLSDEASSKFGDDSLSGCSVCFTGQLTSTLGGEPITRDRAQMLAVEAGLSIRQGVTKDLDLLIVADPHTQSGKAKKARQYGTRILAEQTFWRAIGVPVD